MEPISKRRNLGTTIGLIAALAFFAVLPLFIGPGWISIVNEMLILAVAACALNLILGYTGMVSFGPAGLYAVGAYTTALLLVYTKIPFGLTLIAGPLIVTTPTKQGAFCTPARRPAANPSEPNGAREQ